jgi:hypothetical protein
MAAAMGDATVRLLEAAAEIREARQPLPDFLLLLKSRSG